MDDDLTRWKDDRLLRLLILLIAVHSCVLGLAMLIAPRFLLSTFGFPSSESIFFPSQSGIFLLILAVLYFRALVVPSYVWTILVSKGLAVLFLIVHAAFMNAPTIIWPAAAGDAAMFAATAVLLYRHEKQRVRAGITMAVEHGGHAVAGR